MLFSLLSELTASSCAAAAVVLTLVVVTRRAYTRRATTDGASVDDGHEHAMCSGVLRVPRAATTARCGARLSSARATLSRPQQRAVCSTDDVEAEAELEDEGILGWSMSHSGNESIHGRMIFIADRRSENVRLLWYRTSLPPLISVALIVALLPTTPAVIAAAEIKSVPPLKLPLPIPLLLTLMLRPRPPLGTMPVRRQCAASAPQREQLSSAYASGVSPARVVVAEDADADVHALLVSGLRLRRTAEGSNMTARRTISKRAASRPVNRCVAASATVTVTAAAVSVAVAVAVVVVVVEEGVGRSSAAVLMLTDRASAWFRVDVLVVFGDEEAAAAETEEEAELGAEAGKAR